MTSRYFVTRRAAKDLVQIARYTAENWGRQQRRRYLDQLESRFQWLAENPVLGRNRPEIGPDVRSFQQGSHLIFYREKSERLEILGLVHQSMDIDTYFNRS